MTVRKKNSLCIAFLILLMLLSLLFLALPVYRFDMNV